MTASVFDFKNEHFPTKLIIQGQRSFGKSGFVFTVWVVVVVADAEEYQSWEM